jgi:thiamine pyrophosphokinase
LRIRQLTIALLLAFPAVAGAPLSLIPAVAATTTSKLGDLSSFHAIVADTLALSRAGKLKQAQKRFTDFETAWDAATAKLYTLDVQQWTVIDNAADKAITSLREKSPTRAKAVAALTGLLGDL